MRFLVDECTGPAVARWLSESGHDVFSAFEKARGDSDDAHLERAVAEDRILITNDKDFGELIFRDAKPHRGVILLRLLDERAFVKIEVLEEVLRRFAEKLPGNLVVATETSVRLVVIAHDESAPR